MDVQNCIWVIEDPDTNRLLSTWGTRPSRSEVQADRKDDWPNRVVVRRYEYHPDQVGTFMEVFLDR